MNAIQLIENHHSRIRRYLAQLSKSKTSSSLIKTFEKLADFLISHETMEQKVWYPFLKKNTKLKSTIMHLIAEEKTAAKVITQIKKLKSPITQQEKIMKLKRDISLHAKEEETKLLSKARKIINVNELKKIGKKMQEFKNSFDG